MVCWACGARAAKAPLSASRVDGFTLIELLLAMAIVVVLAVIASQSYQSYRQRVDITLATEDIVAIAQGVESYYVVNNGFPTSLEAAGLNRSDPWGNAYLYTNITLEKGKGKLRKDKNLVPINTDFDLYSAGADGKSQTPLTAKASHDDIIRANNGAYIGLAEDF